MISTLPICFYRSLHVTKSWSRKQVLRSAKGRKSGSTQWLTRQINDPYVKQAKESHYRCRSAYKLIEIDDRFKVFKRGDSVIDCGAAPGSWSQVAVQRVGSVPGNRGSTGTVIAVDLQDIAPIEGAIVMGNSDFTSMDVQQNILKLLENNRVDIVMSDMAPKASGIKTLDHDNIIELVFSALQFSLVVLKEGGTFICKIWQGSDEEKLKSLLQHYFKHVKTVKPNASRTDSAEAFILASNRVRTKTTA